MKTTKDSSVIPEGEYCYSVIPLLAGEELSTDITQFGKDLREFSYRPGYKEVLCPYWRKTDYGMIRCDFLEVQSLDEDADQAQMKAIEYFGSKQEFDRNNHSSYLYDEIKMCDVRIDNA